MRMLALRKANHFVRSLVLKAVPAAVSTGFPGKKLRVYGITGTDGKTTSSTLLYHVLRTAGYKVALISTVAAFIGDEEIDTGFHVTSPEPWQIQRLLRTCLDRGVEHVVLEVTSHGFFQYRTWGVNFELVGVTNITPEHLDYFETYEQYARVKGEFLLSAKQAFLNASDQSYPFLKKMFSQHGRSFREYSQEKSVPAVDAAISERFEEAFNRWNARLVWAMAEALGVGQEVFIEAVRTFTGVRGRMEEVPNQKNIRVVVDFAHTPNGLDQALSALRRESKQQLIAVFGCAGLRDRNKRAPMGRISTTIADLCVFTSEDPRTEDIQVIFRQMKEGVQSPNHRKVVTIADRREAIAFALKQANAGDTIGVFGKGHERSLAIGKTEHPWSDQDVIQEELKKL